MMNLIGFTKKNALRAAMDSDGSVVPVFCTWQLGEGGGTEGGRIGAYVEGIERGRDGGFAQKPSPVF